MQVSLKIVIVDENPIRAAVLEDALREAGHAHIVRLDETSQLLARICALDPDVVIIDLETPRRAVLEQMFEVSRAVKRPVAMFVDESDTRRRPRPPSMLAFPPMSSGRSARSASPTSSICVFRASTSSPVCGRNWSARVAHSRSVR
jgi:CheY-like chemotaxis protein